MYTLITNAPRTTVLKLFATQRKQHQDVRKHIRLHAGGCPFTCALRHAGHNQRAHEVGGGSVSTGLRDSGRAGSVQ